MSLSLWRSCRVLAVLLCCVIGAHAAWTQVDENDVDEGFKKSFDKDELKMELPSLKDEHTIFQQGGKGDRIPPTYYYCNKDWFYGELGPNDKGALAPKEGFVSVTTEDGVHYTGSLKDRKEYTGKYITPSRNGRKVQEIREGKFWNGKFTLYLKPVRKPFSRMYSRAGIIDKCFIDGDEVSKETYRKSKRRLAELPSCPIQGHSGRRLEELTGHSTISRLLREERRAARTTWPELC